MNRIDRLRFDQRISRRALSARAHIPPGRLVQIVNGRVAPRDDERQRLAAVLGVPAGDLFAAR